MNSSPAAQGRTISRISCICRYQSHRRQLYHNLPPPRPVGHTPCVRPTATQNENSLRSNSLALPQQRILFGIFSSYHKITVRTKSQPAYSLRQDQLDLQDCCSARGCPTSPKKIGEPPNFSFYCETEWKVVSLGEIFMILQHWIRKRFARLRKRHKAK